MKTHDYADTRAALGRVIEALDRARHITAMSNIPPRMPPAGVRAQIIAAERAVHEALMEIDAAQDACVEAARAHLHLCD